MRVMILGAGGQLATALSRQFPDAKACSREELDITSAQRVGEVMDEFSPRFVINTAAWNWVDRAEDEPLSAWSVNALGPRTLAAACHARNAVMIQVSTDYVFGADPARRQPYGENDVPGPVSVYGSSKLAGEHFVQAHCPRHFILRTCGLYGAALRPGKGNFVETMLRMGGEHKPLRIVDDQTCTPTSAADLARWIAALILSAGEATGTDQAFGLYHATNAGATTWCGFAREIFRQAGVPASVQPITTAEFPRKARRPDYSALDCDRLNRLVACVSDTPIRPWQEGLAEYLQQRQATLHSFPTFGN